MDLLSLILASAVPIVLIGGLINRYVITKTMANGEIKRGLGVGWQFIRYTILGTGLPIIALLAIKGVLTSEIVALFAAAMGFAFGKSGKDGS